MLQGFFCLAVPSLHQVVLLSSPGTYLDHHYETCDKLLDYGITARGTYIMANGDHVTCFKYSMYEKVSPYNWIRKLNITHRN